MSESSNRITRCDAPAFVGTRGCVTCRKEYPMNEPFIGQIQLFPYNFEPRNWAFCEGQLIPIQQNPALFSLLGTTYGGDGMTTFALLNLKGKEPVPGMHYCIALYGIFPSRN